MNTQRETAITNSVKNIKTREIDHTVWRARNSHYQFICRREREKRNKGDEGENQSRRFHTG